jgi:hypothetical protein
MADDLSTFLLSGSGGFTLTPEKLELMGKEAASLLIEKHIPLEDSVVKLASSHPDMNAEQVRRVVEFANTAAYLSFHDKNKTAGADSSYPQFQLADPQSVMQKLSGTEPDNVTDLDYLLAPAKKKLSSVQMKKEDELERMFLGEGEKSKTASLDFSPETVETVILNTKHDLTALRDSLATSGETFDTLFKQAQADYYDAVKRHMLDGGSFADVLRGAHETGLESKKIASVLTPYVEQLIKEKVASPTAIHSQARELTKVAHREVEHSHPFVAGFSALNTLLDETEKVALALEDVDAQLARVQQAIKEEFIRAG